MPPIFSSPSYSKSVNAGTAVIIRLKVTNLLNLKQKGYPDGSNAITWALKVGRSISQRDVAEWEKKRSYKAKGEVRESKDKKDSTHFADRERGP